MVTYNSTNSYFTATLQADSAGVNTCNAFGLSRTMLRAVRVNTPQLSIFNINATINGVSTSLGDYYTDNDGVVELPLRNIVNKALAESVTYLTLVISLREINVSSYIDTITLTINVYDGISYYDVVAPLNKQCEGYLPSVNHRAIVPPSVMVNPMTMGGTLQGQGVIAESNIQAVDKSAVWAYSVGGIATTITPTGGRLNQLEMPRTAEILTLTSSDHTYTRRWNLVKTDYCTDIVAVRWTSRTGAVRQHYFPVIGYLNNEDEALSIISAGNGYDVRKNFSKGVRCRLTGLTAYDVWYYQDLLLADDAHAMLFPQGGLWSTEIASMETAVYVEGGAPETPQGNGFHNFEITIKLKHYDTF